MPLKKKSPSQRLRELSDMRISGGMGGEGFDIEIEELERQLRLREKRRRAIWSVIIPILAAIAGAAAEHILDIF